MTENMIPPGAAKKLAAKLQAVAAQAEKKARTAVKSALIWTSKAVVHVVDGEWLFAARAAYKGTQGDPQKCLYEAAVVKILLALARANAAETDRKARQHFQKFLLGVHEYLKREYLKGRGALDRVFEDALRQAIEEAIAGSVAVE